MLDKGKWSDIVNHMTREEYQEKIKGLSIELVETLEDVHGGVGTYSLNKTVYRIGDELHMITQEKQSVPNPDKEKYGDYECVSQFEVIIERVIRKDTFDKHWTVTEELFREVELY